MPTPFFKPTAVFKQEFPRGEAHSMDAEAYHELIQSQGVQVLHYRAMGCPRGLAHRDDSLRRAHEPHDGCSNGFLYKKQGIVTISFIGNGDDPSFQDVGLIDGSTVQTTIPTTYDNGEILYVRPFDRFFLLEEDILWPDWETVEYNISGRNRLRYPAREILHVIDERLEEYTKGVDFEIRDGELRWLEGGRNPGINPDAGTEQRGRIATVYYLYQPFWYVQRLSHQNRLTQTEDPATLERKVTRMPMQATLVREHVFENQQRAEDGEEQSPRAFRAPSDGSFSPR